MRVPAGPTDSSWRTRTRRPRGKSAVDSDVVDAMGGHPVDTRSRVDIRADDVPDGINAADHARRDCRPRWTISPLPLNAERRLPRSTVLVATATIRVVPTEGQIYGRQLQQAGDYTGPHRDPLGGGGCHPLRRPRPGVQTIPVAVPQNGRYQERTPTRAARPIRLSGDVRDRRVSCRTVSRVIGWNRVCCGAILSAFSRCCNDRSRSAGRPVHR
jgi:hypothetical protein